jgi:hypothetical protein
MKRIFTIASVSIVVAASVAWSDAASAQQRQSGARAQGTVSREAAWQQCLQQVDDQTRQTGENQQLRSQIFRSCMARLGVRP